MAVIYLSHPIHGNKVACMDLEAEADEKNGWKRYNPGTLLTPVKAAPVVEAKFPTLEEAEIDVLRELWAKKFGKAPHHKKSAEKLRQELTNGDGGR